MSFNIYYSNHLDTLQYIAGYLTKVDPQKTPFDKEYFLVQNFGMARWMQIKLAKQLGILTQAEFLLPSKMMMNLVNMLFSEEELNDRPIERLSKTEIFWPLVKLIDEIVEGDDTDELFLPIRNYLAQYEKEIEHQTTSNYLLGVLHLAEELAAIFDKYIVYRSQWINAWIDGQLAPPYFENTLPIELEKWQAVLFEKLYQNLGRPLYLGMLPPIIESRLKNPDIQAKLPKRIFIIGLNSLPPLFLDLIAQFSTVMDIHLFFNNPSQYYWGDIIKSGGGLPQFELQNFFNKAEYRSDAISPYIPEEVRDLLDEQWQNSYGHPLLASLGKVGRDHLYLLQQYDGKLPVNVTEAFSEPEVSSLLSKIQSEIFHLRPLLDTEKYQLQENDQSIQLHLAYSPMREIEALYNQILHQLNHNPDLAPEDIVIMTPNIELYAPFIHAIFGSAPKERFLPYAISDVSLKESETIFATLLQLLRLPESAFKASELLLLLQMPEIMERFGFVEDDLALLHFWIHDANIKQALDGAQLTDNLQVPYNDQFDWDINTWRWGLQRMLLGYGTEMEELTLDSSTTGNDLPHRLRPYPHIEGKNAEILGKLCHIVDMLAETAEDLKGDKTIAQWQPIIAEIWQRFFKENNDNNDKLRYTQRAWNSLLEGAFDSQFDKAIPLKALVPLLESHLLEEKPEQNFIQGKITFCSFIPMRTIPFKMIAMIGMNQADFPKSSIHHSFDLMQYQSMRGDRNRHTDDRYLFLEALLSAKEILYLSYVGKSIRDNSDLFPSLLIDELLRYIDQISVTQNGELASKQITYHHPMASYNSALFEEGSKIQSFQNEWIFANEQPHYYHAPYNYADFVAKRTKELEENPIQSISIHELVNFYHNPSDYFAKRALYFSEYREQQQLVEDDEQFSIASGLDSYQLQKLITEKCLQKIELITNNIDHADSVELLEEAFLTKTLDEIYQEFHLEGLLPKFAFGKIAWAEQSELPKQITESLLTHQYRTNRLQTKHYSGRINLYGKIPTPTSDGRLLLWDVGGLNHKRLLRAAITNLFYHATKPDDNAPTKLHFICRDSYLDPLIFSNIAKDDAEQILDQLIDGYLFGMKAPLPYFYGSNGKELFDTEHFIDCAIRLEEALPTLFNIAWNPEKFIEILQNEAIVEQLNGSEREILSNLLASCSQSVSMDRLFPSLSEKELLAFILFYSHYIRQILSTRDNEILVQQ